MEVRIISTRSFPVKWQGFIGKKLQHFMLQHFQLLQNNKTTRTPTSEHLDYTRNYHKISYKIQNPIKYKTRMLRVSISSKRFPKHIRTEKLLGLTAGKCLATFLQTNRFFVNIISPRFWPGFLFCWFYFWFCQVVPWLAKLRFFWRQLLRESWAGFF
jgi:hypothetical protein